MHLSYSTCELSALWRAFSAVAPVPQTGRVWECALGKPFTSAWSRKCAGDPDGDGCGRRRKGEKTYAAILTEPTLKEGVEGHRVLLTTGQTAV